MFDFLFATEPGDDLWILIVALALLTYMTRIGGHLLISTFKTIPPRVYVALEAVPAAVLSAIVAPAMFTRGPSEFIILAATAIACLRLNPAIILFLAMGGLVLLRQLEAMFLI